MYFLHFSLNLHIVCDFPPSRCSPLLFLLSLTSSQDPGWALKEHFEVDPLLQGEEPERQGWCRLLLQWEQQPRRYRESRRSGSRAPRFKRLDRQLFQGLKTLFWNIKEKETVQGSTQPASRFTSQDLFHPSRPRPGSRPSLQISGLGPARREEEEVISWIWSSPIFFPIYHQHLQLLGPLAPIGLVQPPGSETGATQWCRWPAQARRSPWRRPGAGLLSKIVVLSALAGSPDPAFEPVGARDPKPPAHPACDRLHQANQAQVHYTLCTFD